MEAKKSPNYHNNSKDEQKMFSFDDESVKKASSRRRRNNVKTEKEALIDDEVAAAASFESNIVIEFGKHINRTTLHWLIDRIRMRKSEGGAELTLKREPCCSSTKDKGLIVHVAASKLRILEIADEIGFLKPTKSQGFKSFNIGSLDDFLHVDGMQLEDILTPAERQFAIKYALENIKADADEKFIPGSTSTHLYQGQSIISASINDGLIVDFYSLHDKEFVKRLGDEWWNVRNIWKSQPIEKIRFYFGDVIGMYFGFVGFYTQALIFPTLFSFVQFLLGGVQTDMFTCCFYVIWMAVFFELWKRKCSAIAFQWGSLTLNNIEMSRPDFYGVLEIDPITLRRAPQYPIWKTMCQFFFVSLPIMLLASLCMGFMALSQFWIEDYLLQAYPLDSYVHFVPSIVQAMLVAILTIFYDRFATYLTDLENHKTQSQYEKYRVIKLIVLEFVNNFFSLLYIAFIKRDNKMLQNQLMTQMIVLQFVQNIQEFLLPKLKQKFNLWMCCGGGDDASSKFDAAGESSKDEKKNPATANFFDDLHIEEMSGNDPRIKQNVRESAKDQYETYDDYLELYIQFGYVVLFSSIAPFAAFWALLNNFIEIRLDAYKLCKTFRRPLAKRAKNIGAWQRAFEVLACLSIITNCGVMYLNSDLREYTGEIPVEKELLIFVAIEHFMLLVAWIIHKGIPDRPKSVRTAIARADYESSRALKRENAMRNKSMLMRRFKSMYDQ